MAKTSKSPAPRYHIKANGELDGVYRKHDINPSWVIAFVRYKYPVSAYNVNMQDVRTIRSDDPLIVENDCISCHISNPKSSPIKTAMLTLKAGEVYYPNAVSPGDWAIIWMLDQQTEIDKLIHTLTGSGNKSVNDFHSGLKFIGRVASVSSNDTVSANGVRVVTQSVTCRAFLELTQSIYYNDLASINFNANTLSSGQQDSAQQSSNDTSDNFRGLLGAYSPKFGKIMENYLAMSKSSNDGSATIGLPPDQVIAAMLLLLLGIDPSISKLTLNTLGISGSFNDAIDVPRLVSKLTGYQSQSTNVSKIYQFYSFYFGIQKYSPNSASGNIAQAFTPSNLDQDLTNTLTSNEQFSSTFFFLDSPCEGKIFQYPPLWSNRPIWGILSDFLNPIVNEMYTCMRINNFGSHKGIISPTLVVREKPFSTGLYNKLINGDVVFPPEDQSPAPASNGSDITNKSATNLNQDKPNQSQTEASTQVTVTPIVDDKLGPRTFFCNVPRWVIDESMIDSVSVSVDDSDRCNFVQVYGTGGNAINTIYSSSSSPDNPGITYPPDQIRYGQLLAKNFVIDRFDIARNGLRADISESQFDLNVDNSSATRTPLWAKMRADWMFNGHLKLKGFVTLKGVNEPICEGDNVEVRGVVYHIESVDHTGSVAQSGVKNFDTVLSISNGILASSLTDKNQVPQYAYIRGSSSANENMPGITDIQATFHSNRDTNGEIIDHNKKGDGSGK